jgi:phage gpG-like protein
MARSKGFKEALKNLDRIEKKILKVTGSAAGSNKKSYSIPLPKFKFTSSGFKDILSFFKEFPKASRKAHTQTMQILAIELKDALDAAMDADSWDWINDTRDIVDTGALKNSGKVQYLAGEETLNISYDEEYAAIVHFGGVIQSGWNPDVRIIYPARPWITATLEGGYAIPKFEFEKRYLDLFLDILARELG